MKKANRLIHEKSPYLLQHATNPVDWYPWGEEAFARSRREDKPIFLSIGYSTCHWCHVMAHESFEDEGIARLMNEWFVCIKIDREERPDIDKVYMTALQAMGQDGGWPMTMFLTPELKPFYGGTYFPPVGRYERAGLPDILGRIHEVWVSERSKVNESADGLTRFLLDVPQPHGAGNTPGKQVLDTCLHELQKTFDEDHGGFGRGPKFPRPAVFEFLLFHFGMKRNPIALDMAEKTLQTMAAGGIYDHIGGGFHRYAVDREWRVPHFEKMLYDQAQLSNAYLDLFHVTRNPRYAAVVRDILDYVLRDMTDPRGGFYSAEDADSPKPDMPEESGEGAFYLWTKTEIMDALGEDGLIFCFRYGVEEGGNAPFDPQQEFSGKNILFGAQSLTATAERFGKDEAEVVSILEASRRTLFALRDKRPRPHRDDKILTSWNGLMIGAFARASQALREPRYLAAAKRATDFLFSAIYDDSAATLKRRFRDGEARYEAHLDDYAFIVSGLISLFENSGETIYFDRALTLTRTMIRLFLDAENGGFYDTVGNDPSLLVRMKEYYDGAEPTGNAVGTINLLRLSRMTGNEDWKKMAECTLSAFGLLLQKQPIVMPYMVTALAFALASPRQIVVVGPDGDPGTHELLNEIYSRYIPESVVIRTDGSADSSLSHQIPFVASLPVTDGKPTAYICHDYRCDLPVSRGTDVAALLDVRGE